MVERADLMTKRMQALVRVEASGKRLRSIDDGRCVNAMVGRRPMRLDNGEASKENTALTRNGIASNEDNKVMGALNLELR